jgi:hypothetical protein
MKIIQDYSTESTLLKKGEAVICFMSEDCVGIYANFPVLPTEPEKKQLLVASGYDKSDADSVSVAVEKAVNLAKDLCLTLIQEDSVISIAKELAVSKIMSDGNINSWDYDLLLNSFNNNDIEFGFYITASLYAHYDCSYVVDKIKEEFDDLIFFSKKVVNCQPKVWKIISDFDGGQVSCDVVRGDYEFAENYALMIVNDIAGLYNHLKPDDELVINNFDEVMDNIGNDEFWSKYDSSTIVTLSIEEV